MDLVAEYRDARRGENLARLRRVLAIRAMTANGASQREVAEALGISQPAVNQQIKGTDLGGVHPAMLLEAAAPILRRVAEEQGYLDLAVFGSVARGDARADSDIDLLVQSPPGTSTLAFLQFKQLLERVVGRDIDLVSRGALTPELDGDIIRESVAL